ncbi:hypothetical protein ABPG72_002293 [Tetrahymena utriculariae]
MNCNPTAPEWCCLIEGFNVESVYINKQCSCFNKTVIVQIGFGTFNIPQICKLEQYKCPISKQKPYDVHINPMFTQCNYEIQGEFMPQGKKNTQKLQKNGQISGDKYIINDENGEVSWISLTIKATPI